MSVVGLTSIAASASAATPPHPAAGTKATSTVLGDRVYTTYEKTGVLRVIIGPHRLSPAELSAAGLIPDTATPASASGCGYGSLTDACLTVVGSGLYVDYMYCEGDNTSGNTVNLDVRLYNPPPSAFSLRVGTGYHLISPGNGEWVLWTPNSDQQGGVYSCTSWVGGQGVNSLDQIDVFA